MEKYAAIFGAISDPTRLRIVKLLAKAKQELCVCEITDSLEVAQYNISRHLKVLLNAGLLQSKKDGKWVYFSISQTDSFIQGLIKCLLAMKHNSLDNDENELHIRLKHRTNGRCEKGVLKSNLLNNKTACS